MRRLFVFATVVGLLLVMAVPALAGKADKARPFKAETEIIHEVVVDGCFVSDHVGTGTHLGRFDLSETLCVTPTSEVAGSFTVVGTLVAANGDELYFHAAGAYDYGIPFFESTGWVFDGGTGRFENASGQADETLIRNSDGVLIGVTVAGTITYDASDRSRR